jgi:hypothetical protein
MDLRKAVTDGGTGTSLNQNLDSFNLDNNSFNNLDKDKYINVQMETEDKSNEHNL